MASDFDRVKKGHEVAKFEFIITELDLALTFCDTALSASTAEKADRNLNNAKQAFQSTICFLKDADLTPSMSKAIGEKTFCLGLKLQELEQRSH
jgi:hypothetical protein